MTSFETVRPLWKNGAAPRSANSGGRLPLRSVDTRREGRAMMPDPNSLTFTPPAPARGDAVVYASALRMLAAERLAELEGRPTSGDGLIALARKYGVTDGDILDTLAAPERTARRILLTGKRPSEVVWG